MIYTINNDSNNPNITIYDSYLVKNDNEKIRILREIMSDPLYHKVKRNRTLNSYLKEWKAHNVLYRWGLFRNRTKDVDFENDYKKIYSLLAIFE